MTRAAIAVEKRVAVSKIAHHLARLLRHERLVLPLLQRIIDGFANVVWMRE